MKLNVKKTFFMGLVLFFPLINALEAASILGHIKIDNFGYRTADQKIAYFTANPGTTVGVYNASTSVLAYSVPAGNITGPFTDSGAATWISGDTVWRADFSSFSAPGTYYVYSTSLNEQSYNFLVNDCIYQAPMTATLKALYYQRCGCAKPAAYAGANWSDAATCHLGDKTCAPAPGCSFPASYGTLDLSGGWHDAGDYNKYIGTTPSGACNNWGGDGGEAIHDLMLAYEWNPSLFASFSSNIPESGNGVPDILNEAKWELDWYLKMQRSDYHVLSVVHQTAYTTGSPPSTDPTTRYYYPPNPTGEAEFVAMLSNSARVMSTVPALASYANTLKSAAENTWNAYVSTSAASDQKFWAAAEIFRMEKALAGPASIATAAQSIVDNYQAWSGFWLNENKFQQNWGMQTYMATTGATASVVTNMKADWGNLVGDIFAQNDVYNSGMHTYDYFWGADEVKMNYAMELLWGANLGATGTHTAAQCQQQAENYLHYMNGANPLNMTLMTNSAAIGASHGIWRIYHSWFGNYGVAFSYNNFIGKPASVVDPLYPYYSGTDNYGISDSGPSTYGPPPGIVPDGPSDGYYQNGGKAIPPLLTGGAEPPYEKDYRDWDYSDPSGNQTVPWVVNETGLYYTASYMVVASAFASNSCILATPTATSTPTATRSSTPTGTPTFSPTASMTPTASLTASLTASKTPTSTATASTTATPTSSPSLTATPSASPTLSSTATQTPTFSATRTATFTPTSTTTNTPADTFTPTGTPTNTLTSTATQTPTASATRTPTATITNTATNSGTPTPTATGTLPTATATPTLTPSGTPTATATVTTTSTASFSPTNSATPTPTSSMTASATASQTPTASLTATASATPTPSPSLTVTRTTTSTATTTPTNTLANTATATSTPTSTPSWTPTFTPSYLYTFTPSPTPAGNRGVVIYPNPSNGTEPLLVSVPLAVPSDVKVQIFTTAFRKVQEQDYPSQPVGVPVSIALSDREGVPLASGLYYVVVTMPQGRSIGKLLILR